MYKVKSAVFLFAILLTIFNCDNTKKRGIHYEDQLGDTPYNQELDAASFKFCDSTNVLHKRALIKYNGGFKTMYQELLNSYAIKESYTSFTGSIIVRFAVNCKGELGRFRTQTVNSQFKKTEIPIDLEAHLLAIIKKMKGWNTAYYNGKYSDCYTFIVVKFKQGKIIVE